MGIVGRGGDGGHNESGNLRIARRYQADLEIKSMANRNPLRRAMGDVGVANNARSKLQIVTHKSFVRDLRVLFECNLEGFRPPRRVCDLQARRKDKPTPIPSTIFYLDRNNQKPLTLHSYSMKPHLSRPRTSRVEEDNPYQLARVSNPSNAQIAIADQDKHLLQLSDAT